MLAATTRKATAPWLAVLLLLAAAPSADEKRISIYSPVATYNLPVVDRNGREYVGLLETLEPLGRVNTQTERQHWRLRFNDIDSEFVVGRARARIRGRDVDLASPFLIENSRGLVAVSSLTALLPRFVGSAVSFHENSRRLFIGDVATHVTAQMDTSNPPRLVLNFSAPVNPTIATEPGKLRMLFARDPLVQPGTSSLSFGDRNITQANYEEDNGGAELTILGNAPLMASFSNSGRTITVTPSPQATSLASGGPPPPTGQNPAAGQPQLQTQPGQISGAGPAAAGAGRRFLVVIDPAHGGDERGAALTGTLAEKDVTLGFARLLRHELGTRGISAAQLRDGDNSLTLDQRAGAANSEHAALYVSLHAASQGAGARVYTALLPIADPGKGILLAWTTAQSPSLPLSQSVSAVIVAQLQKNQIPARRSSASLRPLNNLLMPAVAVELAPDSSGPAGLASANYQQRAASAIADAVASLRDQLGAQP